MENVIQLSLEHSCIIWLCQFPHLSSPAEFLWNCRIC